METAIFYLLRELSYRRDFGNVLQKDIRERVLKDFKRDRKGLSVEVIKSKGYNVYEKSGIAIDSVFNKALELNYVVYPKDNLIQITQKGFDYLMSIYTDNHSESYVSYKKTFEDSLSKNDEPMFEELIIASNFWRKNPVEVVVKNYAENSLRDIVKAYHMWSLELQNEKVSDEDYILHVIPKLYLEPHEIDEDVSLTVHGINAPDNSYLSRPFPNQHYVVAGLKEGRKWMLAGLYPIIGKKEDFEEGKTIRYEWKIGEDKTIVHTLNISFEFDTGRFFSTDQTLQRTNVVPSFQIVTNCKEAPLLDRNRTKEIEVKENGNVILIDESVTLTSFPMHLHSTHEDDKFYESYKEK